MSFFQLVAELNKRSDIEFRVVEYHWYVKTIRVHNVKLNPFCFFCTFSKRVKLIYILLLTGTKCPS